MATKVFISHSWQYVSDLNNLRNLLNERGYFNVEFTEVPPSEPINSTSASYIKTKLTERLKESDIVLGIAGIYATHSDWMTWELDKALNLNKKIIGVKPGGNTNISSMVNSRAVEVVDWNTESIVSAIRRHK